jgi:hypothetical protein
MHTQQYPVRFCRHCGRRTEHEALTSATDTSATSSQPHRYRCRVCKNIKEVILSTG